MVMAGSADPRQPSTRRPNLLTNRSVNGACEPGQSEPLLSTGRFDLHTCMQFDRTTAVTPDHAVSRGNVENFHHHGRGRTEHQRSREVHAR